MEIITRQEAIAQGLNRYFTGKSCKHGHIAERRWSSGGCLTCHLAQDKAHREANREKIAARKKAYREANLDKLSASQKAYKANNPQAKAAAVLRTRICIALRAADASKSARTFELLGASIEKVRAHLESQFKLGMSWDNWSLHGWHVDHIKPCASFDLTDPEQQKACFHYSNLQPLWAKDNFSKHDHLGWVPTELN